jgi:hypothetical protein
MRRSFVALTALVIAMAEAGTAEAQEGFALKGSLLFNSSNVEGAETDYEDSTGFNIGAEMVFPFGLGVGVSGYTAGSPEDFSFSEGSLVVLAEANYFINIPALPVSPYVGAHVGLGTVELGDLENTPRPEADFGDLGFQVGVRFQPISVLGIDAQYRRVSHSLAEIQDSKFESNQFLIGITLF